MEMSEDITTYEMRLVLEELIIRNGGSTDHAGFVIAVGADQLQPWEGLSARRIPTVDRTWAEGLQCRDLVLCPSEMTGVRAQCTAGMVKAFDKRRQQWEQETDRQSQPCLQELKAFCGAHQFSGRLTPILPDRASLVAFLELTARILDSAVWRYEGTAQLVLALLGDIQRHTLLQLEDLEVAPFTTAARMKSSFDRRLMNEYYGPARGTNDSGMLMFPVHQTEAASCLYATWASLATPDFPFIGIPLAAHLGNLTAWPYSPIQGAILAAVAVLVEGAGASGRTRPVSTQDPVALATEAGAAAAACSSEKPMAVTPEEAQVGDDDELDQPEAPVDDDHEQDEEDAGPDDKPAQERGSESDHREVIG